MTGSPYDLPALIVCAVAVAVCGVWAWLSVTRQAAAGRHARPRPVSPEAARFGAYLRGDPEAPEEQAAPAGPGEWHGPGDADWWDIKPPQPPAVEVLTGPGAQIPQTSAVTVSVLARVRDSLMPDAWRPLPAEVTFTPAAPDETCTDLPAVQDAPQYLAAPQ